MADNDLLENITVGGHVLGHTDFFKNNVWFGHTDRDMPKTIQVHAERMKQCAKDYGEDDIAPHATPIRSIPIGRE